MYLLLLGNFGFSKPDCFSRNEPRVRLLYFSYIRKEEHHQSLPFLAFGMLPKSRIIIYVVKTIRPFSSNPYSYKTSVFCNVWVFEYTVISLIDISSERQSYGQNLTCFLFKSQTIMLVKKSRLMTHHQWKKVIRHLLSNHYRYKFAVFWEMYLDA